MKKSLLEIVLLATVTAICTATSAIAREVPTDPSNNLNRSQPLSTPTLVAQIPPSPSDKIKKKYYIAPTVMFGRDANVTSNGQNVQGLGASLTSYGVSGKIEVSDNISVRPFVTFGSGSSQTQSITTQGQTFTGNANYSTTSYGASVTYDYHLPNTDFTPYGGAGYSSTTLNTSLTNSPANVSVPSVNQSSVYVEVGVDYQVSDTIFLNANYKTEGGVGIAVGYGF